jgi:radical SAM family uncharacterized protein
MARKPRKTARQPIGSEIGAIRKQWRGKISIVLAYPNRYHVGMSNLGFQTVYRLFNSFEHIVCERTFLPENSMSETPRPTTVESGRPITDADVIAFSISFENDYPYLLDILHQAGIPLKSEDRSTDSPLILAGGVACMLNPEPLAAFIDCFLIGEAEEIVPRFVDLFEPRKDKKTILKHLARNMPGVYVPAFYRPRYRDDGTLAAFEPEADVPKQIQRVYVKDVSQVPTCSAVVASHTTFESSFLIEVGRGCPHGCRFCSAGFVYRPPRFRPIAQLAQTIDQGARLTGRIGLVGAAVSDLPGIEELCGQSHAKGIKISFSSLRADRLTTALLETLRQSKVKTATIAPEVGSERLRRFINKGLTEPNILEAATALVENGIPNLKLYFMVGLPTENASDVEAIIHLVKKIKHRFLTSSRARKKIGQITVSLNSFVPKPFTPFQWVAMDEIRTLKTKIKKIKNDLKKVANLRINSDVPRWAYIQTLLSRGDRRVADILSLAHANRGNWPQTLKTVPINPDFYVHRERDLEELLPWDFIDHGIQKSYLQREYRRALMGMTTPDCRVDTCCSCGVCKGKDNETI